MSRLLKSWAMPPASWPTASIFWAWRSWSSLCAERFLGALALGQVDGEAAELAGPPRGVARDVHDVA